MLHDVAFDLYCLNCGATVHFGEVLAVDLPRRKGERTPDSGRKISRRCECGAPINISNSSGLCTACYPKKQREDALAVKAAFATAREGENGL
jgi:hypothetical protein